MIRTGSEMLVMVVTLIPSHPVALLYRNLKYGIVLNLSSPFRRLPFYTLGSITAPNQEFNTLGRDKETEQRWQA
jgi:hypothetical protein